MRVVSKVLHGIGLSSIATALFAAAATCEQPVYLSFDTGHMQVAPLVADVLLRQNVRATFFLANEPTRTGGTSLDEVWAPWWKAMAQQGHVFGSHTFDHVYWLSDTADGRFSMRPSAGPQAGKKLTWTAAQYCTELDRSATRFEEMTGQKILPLFRAAGGKTSPALVRAARECGYEHVGWSTAGFLGDELSSDQYPNALLLERALRNIRSGDILVAHLGIWSRQDPWAPAVLEPLIEGLKQKGFCFATMDAHPSYREKIRTQQVPLSAPTSTPELRRTNESTD
jgi:peptidoglycan/xylan/chitin deacetylase (PgdA/CDA1 family)